LQLNLIGASVICFFIGAGLALFDFHRKLIDEGGGTAPISYLSSPYALFFLTTVGGVGVVIFILAQIYPTGPIAKALSAAGTNQYAEATLCGFTTIILIRSKLFEVGKSNVGLDYVYDACRLWAMNAYKSHASEVGSVYIESVAHKTIECANFKDDMTRRLFNALNSDAKRKSECHLELVEMEKQADTWGITQYNKALLGVSIDYIGLSTTRRWFRRYYKVSRSRVI